VRSLALASIAALIAVPAACSYDFTIGEPLSTAGGGSGGQPTTGSASTTSSSTATAPSCADLLTALRAARDAAKRCTTVGTTCTASITDECGCASFVAQSGSSAANAFAGAIEAYAAAGCQPTCASCLPNPSGLGTCLYYAGAGPFCQP
jgi:hypothetical protein